MVKEFEKGLGEEKSGRLWIVMVLKAVSSFLAGLVQTNWAPSKALTLLLLLPGVPFTLGHVRRKDLMVLLLRLCL